MLSDCHVCGTYFMLGAKSAFESFEVLLDPRVHLQEMGKGGYGGDTVS